MIVKAFKLNKIGGRSNIEDTIMPVVFSERSPLVFIVCDGVGGSNSGEVASELASDSFYNVFTQKLDEVATNFSKIVEEALLLFKKRVHEYITNKPTAKDTSTTLTLCVLYNNKLYVAWCGDSRIYLLRKGKIFFKSKDHSLVQEMVTQGIINEQEALNHPQRNIITRSLSANTKPTDITTQVIDGLEEGDWVLQCTDGLLEQFTEEQFPLLLGDFKPDFDYGNHINTLCDGKTKDNYSMYLLNVQGVAKKTKSSFLWIVFLLLAALLGGGAYYYFNYYKKPIDKVVVTHKSGGLITAPVKADSIIKNDSIAKKITTKKLLTPDTGKGNGKK